MKLKRILAQLLTISMSITLVSSFMLTVSAANGMAKITTVNSTAGDGSGFDFEPLATDGEKVTFIVEVEGDPLAIQSGIATISDNEKTEELLAEQQMVMSRIHNKIDATAQKGFVYTAVLNGFSMEGTMDQLDEIKALDGVKNVYISSEIQMIEPVDEPETTLMLGSAEALSGVDAAHTLGYTGEGTVIAIIDSGCDTSHDFFKTAPVNPRYSASDIDNLVKTMPLNAGTASGNQVYKSAKIPYAYNYRTETADTYMHSQSHGTHVAGIAAGKNGVDPNGQLFSGVAPDAQLLIMSCGTESGYFSAAINLAAMNDAILLNADAINMSLSSMYSDVLCSDLYRTVLNNCREAGVSVLASNGNMSRGYNRMIPTTDRPDYGTAGFPCGEAAATAVASVNNSSQWYEYMSLEAPDGTEYEMSSSNENDSIEKAFIGLEEGEYLEYVDCGLGYPKDFLNVDVEGKLALIKRGESTFAEKASNAKAAGAVGILVYNYEEEIISMVELGMPAGSLTLSQGIKLLERTDKRLRYKGVGIKKKETVNPAKIADNSSWGINSSLELKPEIAAPGGMIYSSVSDNKYETQSGTSMAAPHMAGIAALSRQYYKEDPFIEEFNGKTGSEKTGLIENLAMNSASIVRQENGVAYSPRVQGAGLVNMEGILKSRVLLIGDSGKAKLSLGDDLTDTLKLAFDITNISKEAVTFDKITAEVLTDGYEEDADGYLVSDSVAIPIKSVAMPESITVPSGETVTFEAEVKLDADFLAKNETIFTNGFYIDGYVILENEADETIKASLPFTGFYGDWGKAPIFDSTIYDEGGSYLVDSSEAAETGTFLAAGYDWGGIPLGRNPYFPEIIDEKYIAYSTTGKASLSLVMTNLRALKNAAYTITDSAGNVVINEEDEEPLPKFLALSTTYTYEELNGLAEGQYHFGVKATVLGNTETTDALSIPFTIDNTYPEILSAVYDEDKKTVTVKAKENHYFSAFYIAYPGELEKQYKFIQVDDEEYAEDRSVTKMIDVSMIEDISEAEIGCIDYALHQTYYDMDYFLDKVGAELTGIERLKSMTQAELHIKNNTSDEVSADFVLAFYDDKDRLVAMNTKDYTIGANAEEELIYAFFKNTQDASYVKLFVWDFDQLKPVDMLKRFALNP